MYALHKKDAVKVAVKEAKKASWMNGFLGLWNR